MAETTNANETYQPMTFDAIKIGLASPEKIREWSQGEVSKPETINYRTLKPEKDGLFCERIFGPRRTGSATVVNTKKFVIKVLSATDVALKLPKSAVRRERMGHIELAAPVSHIWYFKGIPSRMGLILGSFLQEHWRKFFTLLTILFWIREIPDFIQAGSY